VLVCDSFKANVLNHWDWTLNNCAQSAHFGPAGSVDALGSQAKTNTLFPDGHVEAMNSKQILSTEKYGDRWEPGTSNWPN